MSESDFREQAQRSDGIDVVYYPPAKRGERAILETRQVVRLGDFVVSPGRWTDGGSIPKLGRAFVDPLGYLFRAFLIHDTSLFDGWGWDRANDRLATAMDLLDAPLWQRLAVLEAVRANAKWQRFKARMGWEAMYVG